MHVGSYSAYQVQDKKANFHDGRVLVAYLYFLNSEIQGYLGLLLGFD
jgi:hypothetical protein